MTKAWRPAAFEVGFITQCFRDGADKDYIAARLLYRNGLDQQFLWSAEQAVEKYLKAILLYNGFDTADLRHNLLRALERLRQIDGIVFDLPDDTAAFVEYLQVYGVNRYLQHPSFTSGEELLHLDKTVWHIRRYCQYLRGEVQNSKGDKVDLLPAQIRNLQHARTVDRPHRFRIVGGFLEQILNDERSLLRPHLVWQNMYYGKRRRRRLDSFVFRSTSVNPVHFLEPQLFPVLSSRVTFPPEVRKHFAQLRNKRQR